MKFIDSHLHFFALERGDYHWLKPENPPYWSDKGHIANVVDESDLRLFGDLHLSGYVHIEAGFDNLRPWREIDWLEANSQLPLRTVASCDLLSNNVDTVLNTLLQRQSVAGVRHILDDEALNILQRESAVQALAMLSATGLRFDAQLYGEDTAGMHALYQVCRQFPGLTVIINHAGFPPSGAIDYGRWLANMAELARCKNVAIKLSGWEMTNRYWRNDSVRPVIHDTINLFGEERVMLASNFPLCTWHYSYSDYWDNALTLVPESLQFRLGYQNARYWYGF